jgi:hypothetical protein
MDKPETEYADTFALLQNKEILPVSIILEKIIYDDDHGGAVVLWY